MNCAAPEHNELRLHTSPVSLRSSHVSAVEALIHWSIRCAAWCRRRSSSFAEHTGYIKLLTLGTRERRQCGQWLRED